jgi:hypothetical protein
MNTTTTTAAATTTRTATVTQRSVMLLLSMEWGAGFRNAWRDADEQGYFAQCDLVGDFALALLKFYTDRLASFRTAAAH